MSDGTMNPGEMLSVNQVARLCGVTAMSIYRWMDLEVLPKPLRLGRGKNRTIRFRRADIDRWLAESQEDSKK